MFYKKEFLHKYWQKEPCFFNFIFILGRIMMKKRKLVKDNRIKEENKTWKYLIIPNLKEKKKLIQFLLLS